MNENEEIILTHDELDAIGEIMNISMGSSATAVSAMLDRQVTITTPSIRQEQFGTMDISDLEPAILVKIKYIEGITGTDVIILRRHDMQVILNLLMGNDVEDENFEFDEMSISAACEVMNQMMGASATALSEILGRPVNISTPIAVLPDGKDAIASEFDDIQPDQMIVAVSFQLAIKDVMNSRFNCYLPTALAREVIGAAAGGQPLDAVASTPETAAQPAPAPQAAQPAPAPQAAQPAPAPQATQPVPAPQAAQPTPASQATQPAPAPQAAQPAPAPQAAQPAPAPQAAQPAPAPQAAQPAPAPQAAQPYPQQPYPYPPQPQGYPGYAPYPQQQYAYPAPQPQQPIDVKRPQFPNFNAPEGVGTLSANNMNLLMSVPLDVSVVIGRTRRKIKDIMDFGQGTVVELDKQTGAPAEIMVNGQLLAYGDVIVIGDNFGVRITEIVSTEELLESLHIVDVNT